MLVPTVPVDPLQDTSDMSVANRTAEIAHAISRIFADQDNSLREVGLRDSVMTMSRGEAVTFAMPGDLDPHVAEAYYHIGVTSSVEMLWRRTKIIYPWHPDMVSELSDCSTGTIAGDLFRRIPHTNPLFVLPNPSPISLPTNETGMLYGFYVFGYSGSNPLVRRYADTSSENMTHLGFMFITGVLDEDGTRIRDWDFTRTSVELKDQFTLDEAVEEAMARFAVDSTVVNQTNWDHLKQWTWNSLGFALTLLMYVCTESPDIEDVSPRRAKPKGKGKNKKREKPVRTLRIGYRIGPRLKEAKRAFERARKTGVKTGREQAPHQRRCHMRMFWTGVGRTTPILKFIAPYMVRLDRLEEFGLDATVFRPPKEDR